MKIKTKLITVKKTSLRILQLKLKPITKFKILLKYNLQNIK